MSLRCDLHKLNERCYRIDFTFMPDAPVIKEAWRKDGKTVVIVTTSPWACRNPEDTSEHNWREYEKSQIEKFLEWLGFEYEPLEEE